MKTLCIVPCGSKKIWKKNPNAGPMKAKDVYIGPFASKCQQYAKHFYPESWCILSAKHGFLFHNEIDNLDNLSSTYKSHCLILWFIQQVRFTNFPFFR